jgi:hydrogenase-4 component B
MSTSYGIVVLAVLLLVTGWVVRQLLRRRRSHRDEPWAGGVRELFPEMTYSATGFSNPVRVIFDAILRPGHPATEETMRGHLSDTSTRTEQPPHLVDRLFLDVARRGLLRVAALLARMHHGRVNAYVAYVLATLIVFLILAVTDYLPGS